VKLLPAVCVSAAAAALIRSRLARDSSTTQVVYDVLDLVYPADPNLPTTLYCASNCPTAASLRAYFKQGPGNTVAAPYVAATYNNFQPVLVGGFIQYSVVGAVLTNGGGPAVVDTNSNDYQEYPQYQNGVMSGILFVNPSDPLCQVTQARPRIAPIGRTRHLVQWRAVPDVKAA
jgi:hypothetical protein